MHQVHRRSDRGAPVFLGTYELLDLKDVNTQVLRRARVIPFPRYRLDSEKDCAEFQSVLVLLEQGFPLPGNAPADGEKIESVFLDHWELLYAQTMGCVGLLKDLFTDALVSAMLDGAEKVQMKHLLPHLRSSGDCLKILRYIEENESRVEFEEKCLMSRVGTADLDVIRHRPLPDVGPIYRAAASASGC